MQTTSARIAFLLSQIGASVADAFSARVRELDLTESEAGVIRLLGRQPGISQRALSERVGTPPSRMVAIIDALVERDLVSRARSTSDRRSYELSLSPAGREALTQLRAIAEDTEEELLRPLTGTQRSELSDSLVVLAQGLGIDLDIHSGTAPRPAVTTPRPLVATD